MLLAEYIEYLTLDGELSPEHIKRKEKFLKHWFEDLAVPIESSPQVIKQNLITLCEGLSVKGYNDRVSHLKGFYEYLIDFHKFEGINPFKYKDLKRKKYHHKRRRRLSESDIDRIMLYRETNARLDRDQHTYMIMIHLYVVTGCRCSELLKLTIKDFNYDPQGSFSSIILRDTKSGEDNELPIPAFIADEIYENMREYQFKTFVFENRYGRKVNIHSIEKQFKRVLRNLGIATEEDRGVNLHALRHARAGRLAGNGADPYNLSSLLSHEDINTALWYIQTSIENLRKTARLDPVYKKYDRD